MPLIDFNYSDDLECAASECREANIAYTKEQAMALFNESGTGKLATLADGTAPQWGPGYGGRYEKPGDWAHMTPDEQSAAMERSLREWNEIMGIQPFLISGTAKTPATIETPAVKIDTPFYDKRTNYHLAGLAKCGVGTVRIHDLEDTDEPRYLMPRYDDTGKLIGGAFFIRHAKS